MREFNLIPASYLSRRERVAFLRNMGILYASVIVCFALVWGALKGFTIAGQDELAELQRQQNVSSVERAELTALAAEHSELERKWQLLQSLRSGLSAEALVLSVEGALPVDQVWFTDWRFRREGIVTPEQSTPRPPSYFVQADSSEDLASWQMQTQMTVRGQARDHSALSIFSRSLLALPHVHEVKLQRTALAARQNDGPRLVNFELIIVIKSNAPDASVASVEHGRRVSS